MEWLYVVGAFWLLCALVFAYLCYTAPNEDEVFGRHDIEDTHHIR